MTTTMAASLAATLAALRRLLIALLLVGLVGTATDLLLIGHYEDSWQLIPLVTIALAILASLPLALADPSVGDEVVRLRLFRTAMVLLFVTGGAGAVLHYRANMEFKLEMDPTLHGFALFSSVVRATAPPALAPGTMALLGLLGLAAAFRRPDGLRSGPR
jgi:hypothetical protein